MSDTTAIPVAGAIDQAAPRSSARGSLLAIVLVLGYVIAICIGGLFAKTSGESNNFDEAYIVLTSVLAVFGMGIELRRRGVILLLGAGYFAILSFCSAIMLLLRHLVPLNSVIVATVLDTKPFLLYLLIVYALMRGKNPDPEARFAAVLKALLLFGLLMVPLFVRDVFSNGFALGGVPLRKSAIFGYVPVGPFSQKVETASMCAVGIAAGIALYIRELRQRYLLAALVLTGALLMADSAKELVAPIIAALVISRRATEEARSGGGLLRALQLAAVTVAIPLFLGIFWLAAGDLVSSRIELYGSESSVRSRLYWASSEIARRYFPFGSGAGTFASQPTRHTFYSPLYYDYGFQSIYGTSPKYPVYLMDTWWPKVLAESGVFGALVYLGLVLVPLALFVSYGRKKLTPAIAFGLVAGLTLLSSSIASAPFTGDIGMLWAALVWAALLVAQHQRGGTTRAKRIKPVTYVTPAMLQQAQ